MPRYRIHPRIIAKIMKAMQLSQGGLANVLGVRRETVNRWMRKLQNPDHRQVKHLTRLYDKWVITTKTQRA
jgi:DNA-binding transcriptional regulator YiaG